MDLSNLNLDEPWAQSQRDINRDLSRTSALFVFAFRFCFYLLRFASIFHFPLSSTIVHGWAWSPSSDHIPANKMSCHVVSLPCSCMATLYPPPNPNASHPEVCISPRLKKHTRELKPGTWMDGLFVVQRTQKTKRNRRKGRALDVFPRPLGVAPVSRSGPWPWPMYQIIRC